MGVLDWIRGSKKEESLPLPPPTPIVETQDIPSDIPVISPKDIIHDIPEFVSRTEPVREHDLPRQDPTKPVFVSSDEYSTILARTNDIRDTLADSEEAVARLVKLHASQEQELARWQTQLEELEKKIQYVETVLAANGEQPHG